MRRIRWCSPTRKPATGMPSQAMAQQEQNAICKQNERDLMTRTVNSVRSQPPEGSSTSAHHSHIAASVCLLNSEWSGRQKSAVSAAFTPHCLPPHPPWLPPAHSSEPLIITHPLGCGPVTPSHPSTHPALSNTHMYPRQAHTSRAAAARFQQSGLHAPSAAPPADPPPSGPRGWRALSQWPAARAPQRIGRRTSAGRIR
jgi:hypothetical protein